MGIATDMKNLTQEIVSSYDDRVQRVAALASETAEMMKGFKQAHEEMAEELREGLAKGEATRLKEHAGMMKGIQTRQREREGEVKGMLSAFHDESEKMAAEWQDLTSLMANRRSGRYKPRPTGEEAVKPARRRRRRKQE